MQWTKNTLNLDCTLYALKKTDFLWKFIFNFHQGLTHLSLASLLWDIGKEESPRCDAVERGIPSGAILFAQRNSSKNEIKI